MRMDILQKRIWQLKIAEKIDEAISEHYSLQGLPCTRLEKTKGGVVERIPY